MKRNRNFLLIVWVASLLGLSAVRDVQGAFFKTPKDFVVWEGKEEAKEGEVGRDTTVLNALLSADLFDPNTLNYKLTSAYGSNLLFVAHLWDSVPSEDGYADVKIYVDGREITKDARKGVDNNDVKRPFLDYSDDVWVIPFEGELDSVILTGVVDATDIGRGTTTYTAVVKRGEVDNITALRWIAITDSVNTTRQDTIFEAAAGEDGKLKPDPNWIVSFKNLDKTTTDHWGRADTLYFQKFDEKSTVAVIRNGTDTLNGENVDDGHEKWTEALEHIGNEIYKVKIAAGNSYTIEVTARNKTSKGYYQVTLLADTIKLDIQEGEDGFDDVKFMLKDIYLYEVNNPDRRYTLVKEKHDNMNSPEKDKKIGFHDSHLQYKVTAS
jgi:hypothetical protein